MSDGLPRQEMGNRPNLAACQDPLQINLNSLLPNRPSMAKSRKQRHQQNKNHQKGNALQGKTFLHQNPLQTFLIFWIKFSRLALILAFVATQEGPL